MNPLFAMCMNRFDIGAMQALGSEMERNLRQRAQKLEDDDERWGSSLQVQAQKSR